MGVLCYVWTIIMNNSWEQDRRRCQQTTEGETYCSVGTAALILYQNGETARIFSEVMMLKCPSRAIICNSSSVILCVGNATTNGKYQIFKFQWNYPACYELQKFLSSVKILSSVAFLMVPGVCVSDSELQADNNLTNIAYFSFQLTGANFTVSPCILIHYI
jgi:hypothetical protein